MLDFPIQVLKKAFAQKEMNEESNTSITNGKGSLCIKHVDLQPIIYHLMKFLQL